MRLVPLDSASGLRPITAFALVAVVLGAVVGRGAHIVLAGGHRQPQRSTQETLPAPDFDVVDREQRTLALSVRQLDLVASPRALWQAHTPRRLARALAEALGEPWDEASMLAALLPDMGADGVVRVDPRAILLDEEARRRVELWARGRDERGVPVRRAIEGLFTEEIETGFWRLCWEPAVLLSEEQRRAHSGGETAMVPLLWTRRIADELARCIAPQTALDRHADPKALGRQRSAIWAALLPSAERLIARDVHGPTAGRVLAALEKEGVQLHQLRLDFRHERRYPVRSAQDDDAFEVVGRWRFVDRETALRLACAEFGIPDLAHCPDPLLPGLRRRAAQLLDERHPASGLERLAGNLLASPEWSFLAGTPATYRFRRDQPVHKRARHYYFDETPESETPRVVSTLDAQLQAYAKHLLDRTVERTDAALGLAMVVDVASGDVLAVTGTSPYSIAEFLPTWHVFTPGSTFKTIVMAAALDAGVVRPTDTFFTYNGSYRIENSRRPPIREAEGSPTGFVSASQALARSVNAVLVQIGMKLDDRVLHGYLTDLGYGRLPGVGVGVERTHPLPRLPWKKAWEQASISFGHELGVNLWQHAAGLAAVIGGGEARPLRLLREVRRDGRVWDLERPAGRRVFRPETCATVRSMMELGAREGTGERLWQVEHKLGTPLVFGSKTGTAEKVGTETCLHNELRRNQENLERAARGLAPVSYAEARSWPKERHRSCYTSSICVFGRTLDDAREVMVLVVVDEPRGGGRHFGSHVAGPTAMALLKEALGLSRAGADLALEIDAAGFVPSQSELSNPDDLPWAVEVPAVW